MVRTRSTTTPTIGRRVVSPRRTIPTVAALGMALIWSVSAFGSCGNSLFRHSKAVDEYTVAADSLSTIHAVGMTTAISAAPDPSPVADEACDGDMWTQRNRNHHGPSTQSCPVGRRHMETASCCIKGQRSAIAVLGRNAGRGVAAYDCCLSSAGLRTQSSKSDTAGSESRHALDFSGCKSL